uniref:Uncharacterized protein n=1 Tax=Pararge aegeria TaxID=116150 RepID=S4PK75_9NEOP
MARYTGYFINGDSPQANKFFSQFLELCTHLFKVRFIPCSIKLELYHCRYLLDRHMRIYMLFTFIKRL